MNPKFLVVRYAPGAAGKFLTSLLMSSPSLAHWDQQVELDKSVIGCNQYIQNHFPHNIGDWLQHEPRHTDAWNLHFISMTWPRNDDLSQCKFNALAKEHGSKYFWESVDQGKLIPFTTNKNTVPDFFKDSLFVTVLLDLDAVKWYHRAKWYKHYEVQHGKVYNKTLDSKFHNPVMKQYYDRYSSENKMHVEEKFSSFVRHNIINNPVKHLFMDVDNFKQDIAQVIISLSDILHLDRCILQVDKICKELNLLPVPKDVIISGHRHWSSCHEFKYSKFY